MSEQPAPYGVDRNGTPLTLSDLAENVARAANRLASSLIEFDEDPQYSGELVQALGDVEHRLDRALGLAEADEQYAKRAAALEMTVALLEQESLVQGRRPGIWKCPRCGVESTMRHAIHHDDDCPFSLLVEHAPPESEISFTIHGSHLMPVETLDALGRVAKHVSDLYKAGWRPGQPWPPSESQG